MLSDRDRTALEDMPAYAREAAQAAGGHRREDLDEDRFLYFAFERPIEIVGEAASRASPETRTDHPEIPWRLIVGMRNRLIHGYEVVDADTLWDTVTLDLPPLIRQLESQLGPD